MIELVTLSKSTLLILYKGLRILKRNLKRWTLGASMLVTTLFLSGCMRLDENNQPAGFFSELMYDYIVIPMEFVLDWFGGIFGNYGLAIIALTVIVRLIMLPITLNQQRSMMKSQMQMAGIKPVIDEIQAEMKETEDPQRKQELSQELMMVYQDNDINVFGQVAGCLPLFIQMPIFIAIFHVFRHSEAIATTEFLGIQLGSPSLILALVTGGLYFIESKMMQQRMATDQPGGNSMTLMMPIMMVFIAFTSPAGLTLYFLTSALVGIIQSYFLNNVYKPKIEAEMKEKYGDKEVVERRRPQRSSVSQTSQKQAQANQFNSNAQRVNSKKNANKPGRRRNEGKQNRR